MSRSIYEIEAEADRINRAFLTPLDANEVRDVVNHVHKYRARWQARGHQPAFIERQRHRGRASGRVRFEGSAEQVRPWEVSGVSRRTWYYRRVETRRVAGLMGVALEPTPIEPLCGSSPVRSEFRENADLPKSLQVGSTRIVWVRPGLDGTVVQGADRKNAELRLRGLHFPR